MTRWGDTSDGSARPCAGIPDLLQLLVELTQTRLGDRLIAIKELQCTVLEVKVIEGLGTTMDVVLINGVLREGDVVVVCGLSGPVVTPIRSLLTPHPMKVRAHGCAPCCTAATVAHVLVSAWHMSYGKATCRTCRRAWPDGSHACLQGVGE